MEIQTIFDVIVPAIVLIGVLVFVHEAGHFIVGRLSGIAVDVFSIGFGPAIVNFRYRNVNYRISWIPLGGYVKFFGMFPTEEVPDDIDGKAFLDASAPQRLATVAAGPLANILLAIIAHFTLATAGIPHSPAIVGAVQPGSPALTAGLEFQDEIVQINDNKIDSWSDMHRKISASPGKEIELTVKRDEELKRIAITPESVERTDMLGKKVEIGRIGIGAASLPAIVDIESSSPAANAGLANGDVIQEIYENGQWRSIDFYLDFKESLKKAALDNSTLRIKVGSTDVSSIALLPKADIRTVELPVPPSPSNPDVALGIRDTQLTVGYLAKENGYPLQAFDRILRWEDQPLTDIYDLLDAMRGNKKQVVTLLVDRAGKQQKVSINLDELETQLPSGRDVTYVLHMKQLGFEKMALMGQSVMPDPWIESFGFFGAVRYAFVQTGIETLFLTQQVGKLITGQVPIKALGGPMLIAKVASDAAEAGWKAFIAMMALISVNLAVLNMFPIPALDGGQLLILLVETARRKRLSPAAIENFQKVGVVMIMVLVVLATYNDISRFWTSMLRSLTGAF